MNEPTHLRVMLLYHPAGSLLRVEHDGAGITLDRDEAFELYEHLSAKLGEMPVNLAGGVALKTPGTGAPTAATTLESAFPRYGEG